VRAGSGYVFFERVEASDTRSGIRDAGSGIRGARPDSAERAYAQAREWLVAHGIDVADGDSALRTSLATAFASEALDHVGFTATDTRAVIEGLQARGVLAIRKSAESTFVQPEGSADDKMPAPIEIVRDLDRPETFWCPMHPEVRSADEEKCPVCGMVLVPIPPPRVGEYHMDVAVSPARRGHGLSQLRLTIRDPLTDRPVRSFVTTHERLLHLFIVGRDLQYFQHAHPASLGDGTFQLNADVPPGEYVVIADFVPNGGRSQMVQRAIVTPGFAGRLFAETPTLAADDAAAKIVDGVRVELAASRLQAGREALLRFTLRDAATGKEVDDLQPFLGAPGHMLVVNADLTESNHVHPEENVEADPRAPVMTFQPLMPAAGLYKVWFQFQRRGVVSTVGFVLAVKAP
jgi:hypothetical protein